MDLAENLSKSFEFAKKLFSDFGRLVILIVLDIIPLVNWVVVGYAARVLKETPDADSPPKLEKYSELFVSGAKVFFAALIYMLIPLILIGVGAGSIIAGMFTSGGPEFFMRGFPAPQMLMFGGAGIALVIVGVVLAILLMIVLGAGVAHMIKTGSFGKAFAFGEIFGLIQKMGWGRYLAWIVLVIVIASIVGWIGGAIPVVGWLIQIIVAPALSVFFFRSLGLLYSDAAR
jgi:hypothetical protein